MTAVSGVYARRRARFLKALGSDGIAILPTNEELNRNGDALYPFRAASNFFYLTGFSEPDALAVFIGGTSTAKQRFILFCRNKDSAKEIWDGYRAGQEGAVATYGATTAFSIDELDEQIPGLLSGRNRLYLPMKSADGWRNQIMDWLSEAGTKIRSGASAPAECVAIESILHEMRLRKDREEINAMRKHIVWR